MKKGQYPGGAGGRTREIEEGVVADAEAITAGLRSSVFALERRWMMLPEDAWELETVTLRSHRTIREGIAARWREVEIHHVDLACDYGPASWPMEFVHVPVFVFRNLPAFAPVQLVGSADGR